MHTRRLAAFLLLGGLPVLLATSAGPASARQGTTTQNPQPQVVSAGVWMSRVATASAVAGFGNLSAQSRFLPGDVVWIYAETLGSVRNGKADLVFKFAVTAPDGTSAFDATAEFNEPSQSPNWAAWRSFRLPANARLGVYLVSVEVQNRQNAGRGSAAVNFAVVSAATTTPPVAREAASPESSPDAAGALSPDMEEAFAMLRLKRFDEAVKVFRKALDKAPDSAIGYMGLAKAYEGLGAFKNTIETCDKALAYARDSRTKASLLNMKGVALSARGSQSRPPSRDDLARAEQMYRSALDADPDLLVARYNLGVMHLKAGEDEEGVQWLRSYVAAAPGGTDTRTAESYIENPRRARENYAPDFSLVTSAGEHLDLASLRGKVVVIDFWASWCAPCREPIPYLRKLAQRYANAPFVLISVSVDRDAAAWRSAVAADKMTWPQHRDASNTVARLFKLGPIPTTVILDGEGIIRDRLEGYSTSYGSTLEQDVRRWLKALQTPESKRP